MTSSWETSSPVCTETYLNYFRRTLRPTFRHNDGISVSVHQPLLQNDALCYPIIKLSNHKVCKDYIYIYIYICFSTRSFDASVFMKVAIRICPYVCLSFPGVHPSAPAIDAINSSRWPVNSPHKVSVKGAVTPRRVAWTSEYHVDKSWTVTSENERV